MTTFTISATFIGAIAKPYNFDWKEWISYPMNVIVWDDSFKFKLTQQQYLQVKELEQFSKITLECILYTTNNYIQVKIENIKMYGSK